MARDRCTGPAGAALSVVVLQVGATLASVSCASVRITFPGNLISHKIFEYGLFGNPIMYS